MPPLTVKSNVAYRFSDNEVLQRVAEVLSDNSMAFKVDGFEGSVLGSEATLQAILAALGGSGSGTDVNTYDEATSVPTSFEETIVSYLVPSGKKFYLKTVNCSGTNYAKFQVKIDTDVISTKRSSDGAGLDAVFTFYDDNAQGGLEVLAGKTISVTVFHKRPFMGDFESNIFGRLI